MNFRVALRELNLLNKSNVSLSTILCEIFDCSLTQLQNKQTLTKKEFNKAKNIIIKFSRGIPLQYLTKKAAFMGKTFVVNKNVLIPRFDSEILAEQAMKVGCLNILDLCTGSGVLGITIKLNQPNAQVTLSDISKKALKIARLNAKKLNVKVNIINSNLFEKFKNNKFDLIVCNPPYIKHNDIAKLDKDVKNFEPHLALDGGADGLDFYRKIIKESPKFLSERGVLMFELGKGQVAEVKLLLEKEFCHIEIFKDLESIERVIKGELKNAGKNNKN